MDAHQVGLTVVWSIWVDPFLLDVVRDLHVVGIWSSTSPSGVLRFTLWPACARNLVSRVSMAARSATVAGVGAGAARTKNAGARMLLLRAVAMAIVLFCGCS
jgi:hypothetical protein